MRLLIPWVYSWPKDQAVEVTVDQGAQKPVTGWKRYWLVMRGHRPAA